jgi:hypothetical protein
LRAAAADFDRTLDVERALMARVRLLLDISKLLSIGSAQQRAAHRSEQACRCEQDRPRNRIHAVSLAA